MDVLRFNCEAWNRLVEINDRWTQPVTPQQVSAARQGEWSLILTPNIPVPRHWFPESLSGCQILCLASGGGQQAPILAAAGASVTLLDNSTKQLKQDEFVAQREGLQIETIQGDMADLSCFSDERFDLIFHPCSNCFAVDILPVWREAFRVLKPGGYLLSGVTNPIRYLFDEVKYDEEEALEVRHKIPYSDLTSLPKEEREAFKATWPLEFGHALEDQLGGQMKAGFHLIELFEDGHDDSDPISKYMKSFIATRAWKPTGIAAI